MKSLAIKPQAPPSDPRRDLRTALSALSTLCNYPMTDELMRIYERVLGPFGYDRTVNALAEIIAEMDMYGVNSFPSVGAIRRQITGLLSPQKQAEQDEAEASLAASSIMSGISKFGSVLPGDREQARKIQAYVGPLAWELVGRRGGWNAVCASVTNANAANRERQFQQLARAIIAWQRRGQLALA